METHFVVKNLIILFLAPVLALGVFFLTRDLTGLTASVLDLSELQKIEDNKRWVAYKTENRIFELFGSESVRKWGHLVFEIVYNPDKVELLVDQSSGLNYIVLQNEIGNLQVQLNNLHDFSVSEGRFQVPYLGEGDQLILSEATLYDSKKGESLSIGNLNGASEHSLLP